MLKAWGNLFSKRTDFSMRELSKRDYSKEKIVF
jgi:hypothetical protein